MIVKPARGSSSEKMPPASSVTRRCSLAPRALRQRGIARFYVDY
jgi:hypothetical protein